MTTSTDAHRPAAPRERASAAASDAALVARLRGGDDLAFDELYRRYRQRLVSYCASILRDERDAEEALQSTMMRAYGWLLAHPEAPIDLRPWLFRVAHNECVSILRRRPPQPPLALTGMEPRPGEGPAERIEAAEDLRGLVEDLLALPDQQRGALVLREMAGRSHAQIGEALGVTAAAAKQLVHLARGGLHAMAAGRALDCAAVRRRLDGGDGRVLRSRAVAAHLRVCPACGGAHAPAAAGRRVLALLPALPLLAIQGLVRAVRDALAALSGGAGGGCAGAGAGACAGAASGAGGALAAKLAVAAIAVAVGAPPVLGGPAVAPEAPGGGRWAAIEAPGDPPAWALPAQAGSGPPRPPAPLVGRTRGAGPAPATGMAPPPASAPPAATPAAAPAAAGDLPRVAAPAGVAEPAVRADTPAGSGDPAAPPAAGAPAAGAAPVAARPRAASAPPAGPVPAPAPQPPPDAVAAPPAEPAAPPPWAAAAAGPEVAGAPARGPAGDRPGRADPPRADPPGGPPPGVPPRAAAAAGAAAGSHGPPATPAGAARPAPQAARPEPAVRHPATPVAGTLPPPSRPAQAGGPAGPPAPATRGPAGGGPERAGGEGGRADAAPAAPRPAGGPEGAGPAASEGRPGAGPAPGEIASTLGRRPR
ncbi:RNA polymerase sigma factor [Miltoncostaea marina]|uniref:RNA polymerase sigma factor n=1 Tax=Miltoncostaea marina TaxID=2843215 RepID=UPI001C3CC76A|nr:sigma-70 family RNA polymerase sigma factor [Miltoncostaea marina]